MFPFLMFVFLSFSVLPKLSFLNMLVRPRAITALGWHSFISLTGAVISRTFQKKLFSMALKIADYCRSQLPDRGAHTLGPTWSIMSSSSGQACFVSLACRLRHVRPAQVKCVLCRLHVDWGMCGQEDGQKQPLERSLCSMCASKRRLHSEGLARDGESRSEITGHKWRRAEERAWFKSGSMTALWEISVMSLNLQ